MKKIISKSQCNIFTKSHASRKLSCNQSDPMKICKEELFKGNMYRSCVFFNFDTCNDYVKQDSREEITHGALSKLCFSCSLSNNRYIYSKGLFTQCTSMLQHLHQCAKY